MNFPSPMYDWTNSKGGLASVGHFIRRNEQLYFDELLNFFSIFSKINIVGLHNLCYTIYTIY